MNKKKKKMIDYGRYGYFFIAPFFYHLSGVPAVATDQYFLL